MTPSSPIRQTALFRFHRGVGQEGELVERVDPVGRPRQALVDASFVPHDDGLLARLEEPAVFGEQLFGAAALGVAVSSHVTCRACSPRWRRRASPRPPPPFVERDHGDDAGFLPGPARSSTVPGVGAEPGRWRTTRSAAPAGHVDGEGGSVAEDLPGGVDAEAALASDQP